MTNVSLPSTMSSFNPDIEECHYLQGFVWQKIYLTKHTYRNLIALVCVNCLAIIPTILLNALVIFVVAARRPLQTTSNILLACLAATDLLTGLVVQPIAIAIAVKRAFGIEPFCKVEKVHYVGMMGVVSASFSHVLLISIDRYIAIKDPLRYQEIVTKKRIKKAVFLAWSIAVVLTIQEMVLAILGMRSASKTYSIYWTLTYVIAVIIGLVYIGGISYCYVYIFSETWRQKKRLQTEQLSQEEARRVKKDNKAAKTLTLILGALLITYLPAVASLLVMITSSYYALNLGVMIIYFSWASTSVCLGSLANPIIYCWRKRKLRRAFLEICRVKQPENRAPDIEMIEIQRHRPEIQPSTCEVFSMAVENQEPVLLSFCPLPAVEIVHIEEVKN